MHTSKVGEPSQYSSIEGPSQWSRWTTSPIIHSQVNPVVKDEGNCSPSTSEVPWLKNTVLRVLYLIAKAKDTYLEQQAKEHSLCNVGELDLLCLIIILYEI